MSMASNATFPSGGRLGRRSRAWPRLVVSSVLAVGLAAILVGLVAVRTRRSNLEPASSIARRSVDVQKKTVQAAKTETARAVLAAPFPAQPNAAPPSEGNANGAAPVADFAPLIPRAVKTIPIGGANAETAPAQGGDVQGAAVLAAGPSASMAPPQAQPASPAEMSAADAPSADAGADAAPPPADAASGAPSAPTDAQDSSTQSSPTRPAASSGSYAAYLTSSSTVADARASLAPLQKKYAAQLSGRRLNFHRMRVKGATVYRVRVGRLAQADAGALCDKLQTAGAACDVGPE